MFRFVFAFLAIVPFCRAQTFPAFRWIQEVDGSGMDQFAGIGTDAAGNAYVAGSTTSPNFPVKSAVQSHLAAKGLSNCFVTKLDPSGNIIYSTYFGGSGGDTATAMTVDAAGNVYVTGTTGSVDFPTSKGTYAPSAPPPFQGEQTASFLFKLNPDGSLGYSTYFAAGQQTQALAVGSDGSAYLTGATYGSLPVTPGAYQSAFCCPPALENFFLPASDAFLTRFDPAASALIFSTYLGVAGATGNALVVASDGSAYVGSSLTAGIYRMAPTGSSLLASVTGLISPQAMALAADDSLYVAGFAGSGPLLPFQPTAGAFQTMSNPLPDLPDQGNESPGNAIAKLDPPLQHILAGTYFYSVNGNSVSALALDAAGNVYAGGYTSLGLPMRTPLQEGFGYGFLSELSGDLKTLLFSSYFGADYNFGVQGVAVGTDGSIVIGGPETVENFVPSPANIWVNSLALAAPPALRIDSVVNAASLIDGPISGGETIVVRGSGFGSDAQLLIGKVAVSAISIHATEITASVPSNIPTSTAEVIVQSGGAASNQVLVPVAATAPGIFSANGNGYGQGYILNKDGSLNTPSNPAAPGDRITIYATGVGPVSFTDGYAVTQFPANAFIDGFFCDGVAALLGSVAGFPGNVYRLTVYVPNPASLAAANPNLLNFTFPALVPVMLTINGVSSQQGLAISIAQ